MRSSQPTYFSAPAIEQSTPGTGRGKAVGSWLALILLLLLNLPLMFCMPLPADAVLYDLQAKTVLEGGVLYRDIVEPNLPGVVWVHMAVRSLLGWSTYALRAFDLLVFAGIIVLLMQIARSATPVSDSCIQIPVLGLLLCWFYFSMSEWTHCQRDTWMLLPALGALVLRVRQLQHFSGNKVGWKTLLFWGGLEGIFWGTAFWLKPFIAIPILVILTVSAWLMNSWRESAVNFSGVLLGGALCGIMGSLWLIVAGAWPHFWEMCLNWNPNYFEAGRKSWTFEGYTLMLERFFPWGFIHGLAIPVAVQNLIGLRSRVVPPTRTAASLLSAAYLGWLLQTHTLQHLFDYVHVPETLLGLSVLAANWPSYGPWLRTARMALASLILMALIASPATSPQRLAWWPECLIEGSTPVVRCGVQHMLPNWRELQPVVEFLKNQNLRDRELTTYNVSLIHLYPELGLKPSTRYVFLDVHARIFKDRASLIEEALENSPQRFVVSSLLENGMERQDIGRFAADQTPQLPTNFPPEELRHFPYNQKLVLRSGQYVVHQVTQPVGL